MSTQTTTVREPVMSNQVDPPPAEDWATLFIACWIIACIAGCLGVIIASALLPEGR